MVSCDDIKFHRYPKSISTGSIAMNSFCRFVSTVLFSLLFLSSCGGNDPNDPGNRPSGVLSGDITLADEYSRVLGDFSGVEVSVEGTSYSTVTNADGYWKFDELPSGTYMIRYTRDGFAERRVQNFQFVGGGHYYMGKTRLYRYPSYSITGLNVYVADTVQQRVTIRIGDTLMTNTGAVVIGHRDTTLTKVIQAEKRIVMEGSIDQTVPEGLRGHVAVLFGSDASVSREPGMFRAVMQIGLEGNQSHFHYSYNLDLFLKQNGLQARERVYTVASPSVLEMQLLYDDPEQRKARAAFAAPSRSNVVDLVLE